ncbi:MaoC family dehydratase [Streptomyces phaeolivaceus]|uniref:MaoC family dehydratase n=1 Tax=Streptomyces phaeolivaceus TaxID=2653200 RepID=A0A5P8KG92_9ACTN|nr:MaoC family dehydratase [Streptomyces phaeolivaceus]QFR01648.1 MaoC family dehydratase [Streptomyces phaeolivaceus]
MRIFHGIEDIERAVGSHVGWSAWHTVTQDRIDRFADATGDHQWIHVDSVKAAAGPFGTTIAHGYLTLSLVPMLVAEVYDVQGISAGVNYGANRLRFPAPVPVGSRLRAGVELVSIKPVRAGYELVDRVTVECEGGAKPACVVETVSVLVPAEEGR